MTAWVQESPDVFSTGVVLTTFQTGGAYSARWTCPLGDGLWAVVTRSVYPARVHGVAFLECDSTYSVSTGRRDPGADERWSDCRQCPVDGPPTDDGARKAAEAAVAPDDVEWATYAPSWAVVS